MLGDINKTTMYIAYTFSLEIVTVIAKEDNTTY